MEDGWIVYFLFFFLIETVLLGMLCWYAKGVKDGKTVLRWVRIEGLSNIGLGRVSGEEIRGSRYTLNNTCPWSRECIQSVDVLSYCILVYFWRQLFCLTCRMLWYEGSRKRVDNLQYWYCTKTFAMKWSSIFPYGCLAQCATEKLRLWSRYMQVILCIHPQKGNGYARFRRCGGGRTLFKNYPGTNDQQRCAAVGQKKVLMLSISSMTSGSLGISYSIVISGDRKGNLAEVAYSHTCNFIHHWYCHNYMGNNNWEL